MGLYVVTAMLGECSMRTMVNGRPDRHERTRLVEADSYAEVLEKELLGDDCECVTIRQVVGGIPGRREVSDE